MKLGTNLTKMLIILKNLLSSCFMQVTGRDFESFKNVLQDSLVFFLFNFYTCSLETLQAHLTHSAKWKTI